MLDQLAGPRCGALGGICSKERVQDTIQGSSTSFSNSSPLSIIQSRIPESFSPPRRDHEDATKGSFRSSSRSRPWFLQSSFSSDKSHRRMETCNRFVPSQQIYSAHPIQDGDSSHSFGIHPERRLPCVHRSKGRIFSDSDSCGLKKIPQICSQETGLSIQGPMFWHFFSSPSLHKSICSGFRLGSFSGNKAPEVSRRLAHPFLFEDPASKGCGSSSILLQRPGDSYQQGEVRPHPKAVREVSWYADRHHLCQSVSHRKENTKFPRVVQRIPLVGSSASHFMAKTPGSYGLTREAGSLRQTKDAFSTMAIKSELVSNVESSTAPSSSFRGGQAGSSMVDAGRSFKDRSTPNLSLSREFFIYGCFESRLGYSSGDHVNIWPVERRAEGSPHKYEGATGCRNGSPSFRTLPFTKDSSNHVGQCLSGGIHKQTRGHNVNLIVSESDQSPQMVRDKRNNSQGKISPRKIKYLGGPPQSTRSDPINRVVTSSTGCQTNFQDLGDSNNRSICIKMEQQTSSIRISLPRSPSSDARCPDPLLGQLRGVHLSSVLSSEEDSHQNSKLSQSQSNFNSSTLAEERMVRRPIRSFNRSSLRTSKYKQAFKAISKRGVSQRYPLPQPSRVETIKYLIREKGFSQRAAQLMASSIRESSARVYQSRWKKFSDWCNTRNTHPINASVQLIADFLIFIRVDENLSISTLRGYRAAINQVLRHKGVDLAASVEISALMRHFQMSCPPMEVKPPQWDLALVLRSLTRPPYEPLGHATIKFLTLKTVFLLAFASAKRVGELHGLFYKVSHSSGWKEMSFSFVPEFVAKTQDPSQYDERFDGFSVPALIPSKNNPLDNLLCPVRAMKKYLSRTEQFRPHVRHLFVSLCRNKKKVSRNTISYWLRKVVSDAYSWAGKDSMLSRVKAHDLRSIAPSVLFRHNFAVHQVLKAGVWKRSSTFTRFYLRDSAHRYLDTYSLGPVVAAQNIV